MRYLSCKPGIYSIELLYIKQLWRHQFPVQNLTYRNPFFVFSKEMYHIKLFEMYQVVITA